MCVMKWSVWGESAEDELGWWRAKSLLPSRRESKSVGAIMRSGGNNKSVKGKVGERKHVCVAIVVVTVYIYMSTISQVSKMWAIGSRGLLYDREWLIVNSSGVPLTQKREPRLCQLKPRIDVSNRRLVLSMEGKRSSAQHFRLAALLLLLLLT